MSAMGAQERRERELIEFDGKNKKLAKHGGGWPAFVARRYSIV
jgi:hypothetical protein